MFLLKRTELSNHCSTCTDYSGTQQLVEQVTGTTWTWYDLLLGGPTYIGRGRHILQKHSAVSLLAVVISRDIWSPFSCSVPLDWPSSSCLLYRPVQSRFAALFLSVSIHADISPVDSSAHSQMVNCSVGIISSCSLLVFPLGQPHIYIAFLLNILKS